MLAEWSVLFPICRYGRFADLGVFGQLHGHRGDLRQWFGRGQRPRSGRRDTKRRRVAAAGRRRLRRFRWVADGTSHGQSETVAARTRRRTSTRSHLSYTGRRRWNSDYSLVAVNAVVAFNALVAVNALRAFVACRAFTTSATHHAIVGTKDHVDDERLVDHTGARYGSTRDYYGGLREHRRTRMRLRRDFLYFEMRSKPVDQHFRVVRFVLQTDILNSRLYRPRDGSNVDRI